MRAAYNPPASPSPAEIRKVLDDCHLTMAQAAKLIEVSQSTIEAWIYGRNAMPRPIYTLLLIMTGTE